MPFSGFKSFISKVTLKRRLFIRCINLRSDNAMLWLISKLLKPNSLPQSAALESKSALISKDSRLKEQRINKYYMRRCVLISDL